MRFLFCLSVSKCFCQRCGKVISGNSSTSEPPENFSVLQKKRERKSCGADGQRTAFFFAIHTVLNLAPFLAQQQLLGAQRDEVEGERERKGGERDNVREGDETGGQKKRRQTVKREEKDRK